MREKPKKAAASYKYRGSAWCLDIYAESLEDAEERMRAIRMTGQIDGWPCYTFKAPSPVMHLLLPFLVMGVWIKNLFRGHQP